MCVNINEYYEKEIFHKILNLDINSSLESVWDEISEIVNNRLNRLKNLPLQFIETVYKYVHFEAKV